MDVHSSARQRGVSLIEVMVALFVLSVGMLGISGLSLYSLKSNRDALLRTRAALLAADLADRIRANPAGADEYPALVTAGVAAANGCMDTAAPLNCNPLQIAQDDVFYWRQALDSAAGGIPGSAPTLVMNNATTPPTFRLIVQWNQLGETAADGSQLVASVTLDFQT